MDKLLQLYNRMLGLHIGTKTNDIVFHQASVEFYSFLFDVFHTISEKRQDIGEDKPIDCEKAGKEAYSILEEAKEIIEDMIEDTQTYGMDDLLRGLANTAEGHIGTCRGFAKEDDLKVEKKGLKLNK